MALAAVESNPAATETTSCVAVSLLGGFEIRFGGASLPLPLAAQRVVALLALRRRPVPRAYVAGLLWLDSSENRASASLRSALWRIGLPGCSVVLATNQAVGLAPDVSVDIHDAVLRAHRLLGWPAARELDGGLANPATTSPAEEHRNWLSLSAELLPGWYDDWVIVERERFNQLRVHALEALCQSLTACGRFGPAVEAGHAAVSADPLRESAHRVLIETYLAEGNLADARRQYELYRQLCRHELGCEPSDQMTSLLTPNRTGKGEQLTPT